MLQQMCTHFPFLFYQQADESLPLSLVERHCITFPAVLERRIMSIYIHFLPLRLKNTMHKLTEDIFIILERF